MSYTNMELAEVFIKTGELDDALDALNKQLQDEPTDDKARRLRSSVLLRLSEKTENLQHALEDLQQLVKPELNDMIQQSIIYERLEQVDEAIRVMHKAHHQAPEDERILERLIELMMNNHQYEQVINLLDNAPKTWRWLMRQADAYNMTNQPEKALQALNQSQKHLEVIFPDLLSPVSRNTMARIHIARGQIYMTLGKLDSAETDYKDALFHIPEDATIKFNLGLVYARQGKLQKAKKICQSALDNTTSYLRETLLDVLNSDEQYKELKQALNL